jgi:hypothetical protein
MNLIHDIFDQLFSDKIEITPAKDASPEHRYFVISSQGEPRWIIPCNPALGWPVLRFWKPFNLTSRLLWKGLCGAYRLRGLGSVPGVEIIGIAGTGGDSWENLPWRKQGPSTPVIYVGTVGPTRKATVTLVDTKTCIPQNILKIPLGPRAGDCIVREAENLLAIGVDKPGMAPQLQYLDRKRNISSQEMVMSANANKRWTRAHERLLLDLVSSDEYISLSDLVKPLAARLEQTDFPFHKRNQLREMLSNCGDTTPLKTSWTHGDFIWWNMKWKNPEELILFDWEFAERKSVVGLDIMHYIFIEHFCAKKYRKIDRHAVDIYIRNISDISIDYGFNAVNTLSMVCFYLVWYQVKLSELSFAPEFLGPWSAVTERLCDATL